MRCGTKKYKGNEIPVNAVVKKTAFGDREYYLSGINETHALLKFLDTGAMEKVNLQKFTQYGY